MDLNYLENALNNGDFKEQVYSSLEGIYQISKVLNQLEILDNFNDHDLNIAETIATIKSKLAGYKNSEQELKAKIDALVTQIEAKRQELEQRLNLELQSARASEIQKLNEAIEAKKQELKASLNTELQNATTSEIAKLNEAGEAKKQELEARLNTELQSARASEIQKLNEAGDTLKTNLITLITNILVLELGKFRDTTKTLINTPRMQGVNMKFVGLYVYGRQSFFKNESDEFRELFEFASITLKNNKSYIVQFSMPYELSTNGIYSESMGEMVLCLKANNKIYPIINSFYQNKTANLVGNKIVSVYLVNSPFKTPSEEADYKIALFARKHKDLWVNVNYSNNMEGFETSFLNSARFANATTHSIPTEYNNDRVFYKHSQALVYEILP
ncbi:coiled-coil domain-containing protein [Helicobacter pylori]